MISRTYGATTFTLPADTEITMTREFDAPPALVFEAYTTPEHVRRWWAWADVEWLACEIDLRVGGTWRWVFRQADGNDVGFRGIYQEIDRPGRLVHTEIFELFPEEEALVSLTLEGRDGRTLLTSTTRYSSQEVRDMVLQSGMEEGAAASFDRLAEVVASLA